MAAEEVAMAYSLGAVERAMKVQEVIVLRQNSVRRQVIDLAGLIQRKFRLDGHPPAPPAATPSPLLLRSPPSRPEESGLAPPARRLQEDGGAAEDMQERPTLLGRAVEGVGRLEAGSRHRVTQHRCCGGSGAASASTGPSSPAGPPWAARQSTRRSRPLS